MIIDQLELCFSYTGLVFYFIRVVHFLCVLIPCVLQSLSFSLIVVYIFPYAFYVLPLLFTLYILVCVFIPCVLQFLNFSIIFVFILPYLFYVVPLWFTLYILVFVFLSCVLQFLTFFLILSFSFLNYIQVLPFLLMFVPFSMHILYCLQYSPLPFFFSFPYLRVFFLTIFQLYLFITLYIFYAYLYRVQYSFLPFFASFPFIFGFCYHYRYVPECLI